MRSLFIVGRVHVLAFGLWNVLLLPFSITVLGATEFEYGLQEGLTSVGFVIGRLFMARFTTAAGAGLDRRVAHGMGIAGLAVRLLDVGADRHPDRDAVRASPAAVVGRRGPSCCSATRRARCAAACSPRSTSCATSSSCSAWPAPAWPTSSTSGCSIIFASLPAVRVRRRSRSWRPGLGLSGPGARRRARLRSAAARRWPPSRVARRTLADFDRLAVRLGVFGALVAGQRDGLRPRGDRPRGARRDADRRARRRRRCRRTSSSMARRRRASRTDGGYRGLSTMTAGDFFGEIARADREPADRRCRRRRRSTLLEVPADALRATMAVPEIQRRSCSRPCPAGSSARTRPTCRGSPASTRPSCATCGRRGPAWRPATRRDAALRRRPGDGPHRVDADDDRRARVERQLVADLAAAEQLAEERALARRQADEDVALRRSDRGDVVVPAVDGEAAAKLVHRHVRAALDEAAQLRAPCSRFIGGRWPDRPGPVRAARGAAVGGRGPVDRGRARAPRRAVRDTAGGGGASARPRPGRRAGSAAATGRRRLGGRSRRGGAASVGVVGPAAACRLATSTARRSPCARRAGRPGAAGRGGGGRDGAVGRDGVDSSPPGGRPVRVAAPDAPPVGGHLIRSWAAVRSRTPASMIPHDAYRPWPSAVDDVQLARRLVEDDRARPSPHTTMSSIRAPYRPAR